MALKDLLPPLPWQRKPKEALSPQCYNTAFITDMVYQKAVQLDYDLLLERREEAERRILDLEDMMPQVTGLTKLTTQEEREGLVKELGSVRTSLEEGDFVNASYYSDRFGARFREVFWNIIVRCECD